MTILVENIENIRIITLNRPEKLNAITLEMATELTSALQEASADSTVKCIILTGKGRSFSSGGDVNEMAEHSPKAGELFYKLTDQIHSSFTAILRMKKPVINALNGIIAGGALGIALGGDYRIAAKSTRMLSAHFKRGFVPAGGATYLLPRLIGLGRTQALFFGGKTLKYSIISRESTKNLQNLQKIYKIYKIYKNLQKIYKIYKFTKFTVWYIGVYKICK